MSAQTYYDGVRWWRNDPSAPGNGWVASARPVDAPDTLADRLDRLEAVQARVERLEADMGALRRVPRG